MLYTYKYIENHKIEKLQEYIEFFFENIFREEVIIYGDDLIHPDFICIVDKCGKLEKLLKDIFVEYKKLDKEYKKLIIQGFKNNNLIDKLCDGEIEPIHYKDIPKVLSQHLKNLFKYLYEDIPNTSVFKSNLCDMKDHFNDSRKLNKQYKVCPFCGLYRLDSQYDKTRDAYDHYLPKTKYPFNSVNFRNLVPICDKCNSGYKKTKDPLFKDDDKDKRRKVFYPFDKKYTNNIGFKLSILDQGKVPILEDKWIIDISSELGKGEEIDSWDDIFEIKARYLAEIEYKIDDWINQFYVYVYRAERNRPEFDFNTTLEKYLEDLRLLPLVDQNFLKAITFELLAAEYNLEELLNKMAN